MARPTVDHLEDARRMLADLEQLFQAGKESAYAYDLREVLAGGEDALIAWLTSGDFWGGMGSMIDCAFCAPTALGPEADRANRQEFMNLIIRLGKHRLASGICTAEIKSHIKKWTSIFEGWLDSDLV